MIDDNIVNEGPRDQGRSVNVPTDGPLLLACDIAVSCRVRLARNIVDFPFVDVCSDDQRSEISRTVRASIGHNDRLCQLTVVDAEHLEILEEQFLAELELVIGLGSAGQITLPDSIHEAVDVSGNDARNESTPAVAAADDDQDDQAYDAEEKRVDCSSITSAGSSSRLFLNLEDHLRLQITQAGMDLKSAWSMADQLDDLIEQRLSFAFSPRWGYLTACPANVGTGMRASVVLHLPALNHSGEIAEVLRGLARSNIVGRELFGDPQTGDFYRFSNQATLGLTESDLITQIVTAIPAIVAAERAARKQWLESNGAELKRIVDRALLKLKRYDLDDRSDEALFELTRLLSHVRLGLQVGTLSHAQTTPIANRFELIQLQHQLSVAVAAENYTRATWLRDRIQFLTGEAV